MKGPVWEKSCSSTLTARHVDDTHIHTHKQTAFLASDYRHGFAAEGRVNARRKTWMERSSIIIKQLNKQHCSCWVVTSWLLLLLLLCFRPPKSSIFSLLSSSDITLGLSYPVLILIQTGSIAPLLPSHRDKAMLAFFGSECININIHCESTEGTWN